MALCINIYQIFIKFLHIIAFGVYIFSIFYDISYVVAPEKTVKTYAGFGGRSGYLTYWCLVCNHNKIDKI